MQKSLISMAVVMLLADSTEAMRIRPSFIQLEQEALARLDRKQRDGELVQMQDDGFCSSDKCYT